MNELKVHAPAGERLIIMTRIFEAPRALVWKAMTQREHIGRWWGASSFTEKVVVAKYDFRPGGEWRFESHGKDGKVYVFKGRILEIEEPRRVVQTFGMEGMFEDKLIVEDLSLEELPDGRTLYHQLSTYDSVEDRDSMVASGMEDGARQTLDELERVIAGLKAQQAVQQQQ
ncbi:MAG TPA: ATPase [Alphaproteobacteria bacterium]|nr:ATPase [Alphaproteobacteria bacterium]